ncbi:MAG: DUF2309 domain-containing protein [Polyangiaceae bacterium]|nr:DUF2309 domain-containing protein [Polyangiaceae bacterium]
MMPAAPPPPYPSAVTSRFDLEATLHRVAHWLPTQGPIKDFIHHNTLHAFQGMPFHEGVAAAARLYGARASMPPSFFLDAYKAGRISDSALDRALAPSFPDETRRAAARQRMLSGRLEAPTFAGRAREGLRSAWTERLGGVALHRWSHLHLFRLFGGYLDQGLSTWRMPGADRMGFYDCVAELVRTSRLPLLPFDMPRARALLDLPASEALLGALAATVGREDWYEPYLLETSLSQPGWSGLIAEIERNASLLLTPRRVSLLDSLAVTLVAEVGCIERELGAGFAALGTSPNRAPHAGPPDAPPDRDEAERLLAVWQEAFEWSYYEPFLGAIRANAARRRPAPVPPAAWAVFCLDDRSCSVRRHLEEVTSEVATFGTAGFFGLDFYYRGVDDAVAGKHCPAPMKPRHLIVEEFDLLHQRHVERPLPRWRRALHFETHANTLIGGWVLSYALGLGAAARLAANIFRPSLAPVTVAPLSTVNSDARFKLLRKGDAHSPDGLWLGYSAEELAERVAAVLRSMGADHDWPRLVVLFGHGASSVNNPYFAAYNCGACSGRVGAPNARAFAKAANHPEVREVLRARGLTIPDSTLFVGALYDTTRDEATYYDLERMPDRFRAPLLAFQRQFNDALARNAAERCRRFESVPLGTPPKRALEEVRRRSMSLFEPRPEYNHATNASCVVGRRALTAELFLDRRTFLSSYEPKTDPEGYVLTHVLSAVIPVCAGINLEYLFSRLDPRVYGAGTKLPHNVNGLLGVCNGIEGDLLTGLPTQMTEIHDPVRLIVVVEQSPAIALQAARANPAVFEFIEREWVRYACLDPASGDVWIYRDARMVKVDGLVPPRWAWPSSLEAARQGRDNLPVGFVFQLGTGLNELRS